MSTKVQFEDKTAAQQADSILRDLRHDCAAQERVNLLADIAFHGQTKVAPADSALGILALSLADEAKKHAAAKKAGKVEGKFQLANMLATRLGRWLKGQKRFEGKRVSIRTTGTPSIALVTRTESGKGKPKAKGKGKGSKSESIKNVKDLASLIKYAIEHYGAESVAKEAAKQCAA